MDKISTETLEILKQLEASGMQVTGGSLKPEYDQLKEETEK